MRSFRAGLLAVPLALLFLFTSCSLHDGLRSREEDKVEETEESEESLETSSETTIDPSVDFETVDAAMGEIIGSSSPISSLSSLFSVSFEGTLIESMGDGGYDMYGVLTEIEDYKFNKLTIRYAEDGTVSSVEFYSPYGSEQGKAFEYYDTFTGICSSLYEVSATDEYDWLKTSVFTDGNGNIITVVAGEDTNYGENEIRLTFEAAPVLPEVSATPENFVLTVDTLREHLGEDADAAIESLSDALGFTYNPDYEDYEYEVSMGYIFDIDLYIDDVHYDEMDIFYDDDMRVTEIGLVCSGVTNDYAMAVYNAYEGFCSSYEVAQVFDRESYCAQNEYHVGADLLYIMGGSWGDWNGNESMYILSVTGGAGEAFDIRDLESLCCDVLGSDLNSAVLYLDTNLLPVGELLESNSMINENDESLYSFSVDFEYGGLSFNKLQFVLSSDEKVVEVSFLKENVSLDEGYEAYELMKDVCGDEYGEPSSSDENLPYHQATYSGSRGEDVYIMGGSWSEGLDSLYMIVFATVR